MVELEADRGRDLVVRGAAVGCVVAQCCAARPGELGDVLGAANWVEDVRGDALQHRIVELHDVDRRERVHLELVVGDVGLEGVEGGEAGGRQVRLRVGRRRRVPSVLRRVELVDGDQHVTDIHKDGASGVRSDAFDDESVEGIIECGDG